MIFNVVSLILLGTVVWLMASGRLVPSYVLERARKEPVPLYEVEDRFTEEARLEVEAIERAAGLDCFMEVGWPKPPKGKRSKMATNCADGYAVVLTERGSHRMSIEDLQRQSRPGHFRTPVIRDDPPLPQPGQPTMNLLAPQGRFWRGDPIDHMNEEIRSIDAEMERIWRKIPPGESEGLRT